MKMKINLKLEDSLSVIFSSSFNANDVRPINFNLVLGRPLPHNLPRYLLGPIIKSQHQITFILGHHLKIKPKTEAYNTVNENENENYLHACQEPMRRKRAGAALEMWGSSEGEEELLGPEVIVLSFDELF